MFITNNKTICFYNTFHCNFSIYNKINCIDKFQNFGQSINIINTVKKNKRNFIFSKNRELITSEIFKDLEDNKKIVIVSMSSKKAKEYKDLINEKFKDKQLLIYTGKSDDKCKDDLKNVLELWSKTDVLIYSPYIEAGVNFDLEYFDKIYGIICNKSTSPRGFMQMIARIRKIKDTNIKILNEQFDMINMKNFNKVKMTNFYKYEEVKQGIMALDDIKLTKIIIDKNGKKIMVNKLSLYDENYIYNRQENLNSEYYYFLPSLLILMKNKGHNYEIHNNIKSKNIDKKILNEIILQIEDIDDEDYILFLDNQKKSVATEDEKYKIQKHSLKILYGVDKLNEDILKLEGYQIKNFCGLIDINNISNSKDNQTKEQKKKIEVINELLNNIGFNNIYDNNKYVEKEIIENKRNDIIKNTTIFKDEMIRKVLFNESKYNDDITTNKAFLGYVNTLLDCFCLKIYSDQMRLNKLTKDEKKTMTIEEIEVYDKKREKGYKYIN